MAGASGVGSSGVLIGAGVSGAGLYSTSNSLDIYGRPSFLFDTANSQYRNGLGGGLFTSFSSLSGLTFTRASKGVSYAPNSAGFLIPFDGADTNLLTYSQDFDNASWTKGGSTPVSVTTNQTIAPDGTLTMDLIAGNPANNDRVEQAVTIGNSTTYTYSCYLKAGTATKTRLNVGLTSGGVQAVIDWSGSTLASITPSTGSASFASLGGGIYRAWFIFTSGASDAGSTPIRLYPAGHVADGGITGNIYAWGAQLEQNEYATSYIRTISSSVTRTVAPRITDKGLLIEEARTNLCLQSQTFDNASWTNWNITVTADAIAAPDGTLTADLLTVTTTAATLMVQSIGAVSGANCCASIYVQKNNRSDTATSYILYDLTAGSNKVACSVNWAAMTVSGTGASIERLGSTNWYRIILVDTAWTSGNVARFYAGAGGGSLTGGLAWYQWGAQVEAAAFPSSYIPTTSSSATRAADVCSIAVSGISYPATLFAEFERVVDTGGAEAELQLDAGSNVDNCAVFVNSSDLGGISTNAGGVSQASLTVAGALAVGTVYRIAGRFAANDVQMARSGTLGTQDTSATSPATPTRILLGSFNGGANPPFGFIKRAAVWNSAFTDAQLQAVSS